MKFRRKAIGTLFTLLPVTLLLLSACRRTTPPGPNAIGGTIGSTTYTMLAWDEGLRILLWGDIVDAAGTVGTGSTEDEVYRQSGGAEARDGRAYSYSLETRDGVTADFTINGKSYDLEQGALFLIKSRGDTTAVRQLDIDLSTVLATNAGIERFAQAEPIIATFIQEAGGRQSPPLTLRAVTSTFS